MRIAVYMQENEILDSFLRSDGIYIYQKADEWRLQRTIMLQKPFPADPGQLRHYIRALADGMRDCRAIAGGGMRGLTFNVFNKLDYSIFDIEAFSPSLLDAIEEDVNQASRQVQHNRADAAAGPTETAVPGVYKIDLIRIQHSDPALSSKKILKPFLEHTPFFQLNMTCSHIPPWLENGRHTITQIKRRDGSIEAIITKAECREDR